MRVLREKIEKRAWPGERKSSSPGSRYFLLTILAIFAIDYLVIGPVHEFLYRASAHFLLNRGMDSALAWFYSSFVPGTLLEALLRCLLILWGLHLFNMRPFDIGWKRPKNWLLGIGVGIAAGIAQYGISGLTAKLSDIIFFQRLPYVKVHWDSAWTNLSNPTDINRVLNSWTYAPLLEELLYRGLLYSALKKRFKKWQAVLISSSLFALMHFYYLGDRPFTVANVWILLSSGIVYALLLEWDGTLLAPIAAHAAADFMAFALSISIRMF